MGVRADQYSLATNATFRGIIEAAVVQRAITVLQSPTAPEQEKGLARTMLMGAEAGSTQFLNQFVWAATTVPVILAGRANPVNIADTEIDTIIAQAWPIIAG